MKEHPKFNIGVHGIFLHKNGEVTINCYPDSDSRCLRNMGGMVFKRTVLERLIQDRGYLFDSTMDRLDDADMGMALKKYNEQYLFFQCPYSHYNYNDDNLSSNTSSVRHSLILLKLCVKYRTTDGAVMNIKNIVAMLIKQAFNFDIVKSRSK